MFFLLGAISGLMKGLSWPPFNLWWLSAFYLVPFLFLLPTCRTLRQVAIYGMGTAMLSTWLGFYWLAQLAVSFGGFPVALSPLVVLLYSLIGELPYLIFALILWWLWWGSPSRIEKKLPLLFYPALYTVIDGLYPKIFCDTQGAMLYPWHQLIQIAEHVGVLGLTFLVAWWNVALTALVAPLLVAGLSGRSKDLKANSDRILSVLPRARVGMAHLIVCSLMIGGAHHWGLNRISELDGQRARWSRHFKAAVIQANIGDADKLASENGSVKALEFVLNTYADMTYKAVAEYHPNLVVWPETAFPYNYTHLMDVAANQNFDANDAWMKAFIQKIQTPLFFGSYSRERRKEFNTAFLVRPPFDLVGIYRKSILLAFGEYVPLGPFSNLITSMIPAIGNFGVGLGPKVFDLGRGAGIPGIESKGGPKIGPLICYESIVPYYPRDVVRLGPELLLNITNDSWFGESGEPYSHLYLTAFRSIELRRPLLRSTNTGITALIDPTGRIVSRTSISKPEIYSVDIPLPAEGEPGFEAGLYLRWGNWVLYLCGAFVLAVSWGIGREYLNKFLQK